MRHQSQGMEQSRQNSGCVSSAAEPKDVDTIARLPCIHQIGIGLNDIGGKAGAESETYDSRPRSPKARDPARIGECAYPWIIVNELPIGIALEALEKTDDIGILSAKFIARAVATDHQVASPRWHGLRLHALRYGEGVIAHEPRLEPDFIEQFNHMGLILLHDSDLLGEFGMISEESL